MRVLFVAHFVSFDVITIAAALQKQGLAVDLLCFDASGIEGNRKLFDHVFALDWVGCQLNASSLMRFLVTKGFWQAVFGMLARAVWPRYDIVYARSETNLWCAIGVWWFKVIQRIPLVYNPYDVTSLRERREDIPLLERRAETFLFRRADALVHNIGTYQLHILEHVVGQLPKKVVQLLPYPPRAMSPDLSPPHPCHSPVRIVYIGNVALSSVNHHPDFVLDRLARILSSANAELHVYPSPFGKSAASQAAALMALGASCQELRVHASQQPSRDFVADLAAYDYGWFVDRRKDELHGNQFAATAFGAKLPVYLLAGLPVIASANYAFVARYVTENEVGLVWETFDPDELSDKLKRADYARLCANVRGLRSRMVMEDNIDPLIRVMSELTK